MSNLQQQNATNNNQPLTLTIGQSYTRKTDKAQGQLIEGNKIRFEHPIAKTFHVVPMSDKWELNAIIPAKKGKTGKDAKSSVKDAQNGSKSQQTPIQPDDATPKVNIDDLASDFDAKQGKKGKGKTPKTDETPEILTDDEVILRKDLEKQFRSLKSETEKAEIAVVKNPFKLAKIIDTINSLRLYRNTHKTFELYAIEVLKIERQTATAYSSIGAFAKVAEFYLEREKIDVSYKASNRLVINQNALRDSLQLSKQTPLSDFSDLISEVVEITGKVARKDTDNVNDNVALTPRIIDESAKVIQSEITNGLQGETFAVSDTIARALSVLQGRKDAVITKAKIALTVQPKADLPNCESHTDITQMKVKSFANGILTLDCGCTFRQFTA